ncbi:hypothetical protein RHSIM_RhsimUnG0033300 [Rhododendron simsii]|uniref:Putative gamma-glutamylcyclotransferase n=1 Tax=Rhododendron simsii TaxID=118357 RepID=A0A834FZQ7_RHOSS|nr:hypothetical protein RHSIM_RhsimUnG0033300 [Rhododendron simsii]
MGSSSMSTGQRLHNVFVYGSLLADELQTKFLSNLLKEGPFEEQGHKDKKVAKAKYYLDKKNKMAEAGLSKTLCYVLLVSHGPHGCLSMLQAKNHVTQVLSGITDPELDVLDTFEDVEYERRTIEVSLMDSSQKLTAYTYVWANINDPNLYGDWHFEEWRLAHMKDFINMTTGFMEELELPESKPRVDTYESFYKQSGDTTPMS